MSDPRPTPQPRLPREIVSDVHHCVAVGGCLPNGATAVALTRERCTGTNVVLAVTPPSLNHPQSQPKEDDMGTDTTFWTTQDELVDQYAAAYCTPINDWDLSETPGAESELRHAPRCAPNPAGGASC